MAKQNERLIEVAQRRLHSPSLPFFPRALNLELCSSGAVFPLLFWVGAFLCMQVAPRVCRSNAGLCSTCRSSLPQMSLLPPCTARYVLSSVICSVFRLHAGRVGVLLTLCALRAGPLSFFTPPSLPARIAWCSRLPFPSAHMPLGATLSLSGHFATFFFSIHEVREYLPGDDRTLALVPKI